MAVSSNQLYDALFYGNAQRDRLIKLDTPLGKDWLVPLQAKGRSRLGRDYEFVVDASSARGEQIELDKLIGQPVTLWIQQIDGAYLPHHGYVHTFSRLGADGTLTYYQLRFSSWMHFLRLRRDMRDWQEKSGEQIVSDVLEQHPQAHGAYRFELKQPMPHYSNRVQWEFDWDFVHRSFEETGVFGRFEQADDGKSHTLVLMDDLFRVPQLAQKEVRFIRTGLREEVDGLFQWKEQQRVQSAKLTTRTFDYKRPDLAKQIARDARDQDKLPAHGEVYDYTGAHTWSTREDGEKQATIRMEEWASRASRFHGVGSLRSAMPGRWFALREHPVHDAESSEDREFAILAAEWTIRNNLPGMEGIAEFPDSLQAEISSVAQASTAGVSIRHPDGNVGFFQVEIEAQRRRLPYRSPFEHPKPVMPLQTGIIAGPQDEEVYTDDLNRVKVWFPWNRLNEGDEGASIWVRSAFPDAGADRGGTYPLRKGDEVVIAFVGGDCDRPFIVSRMHGGATPPVWHSNGLLSGHRSKEYGGSGYNQLVMDDATGQNRIHLYSTSANSHLHLGYLIQHTGNTRGAYLGSGFDLKSDAYGAVRAAQGLYVSTHPKAAASQPLDVRETQQQLINAETMLESLSDVSIKHEAESLKDGHDALRAFTDATQKNVPGGASTSGRTAGGGTGNANAFDQPVMLFGSPGGLALSTQHSLHVAATEHVNLISAQSTHIATDKSFVASIGEKLSLFVQNAGMKLFAAKGSIEVRSQSDDMELAAQKTIKMISTASRVEIAADQGISMTSGGAYIKVAGGNIRIHAPGKVDVKGGKRKFNGPASMGYPLPSARPDQPGQLELLHEYQNLDGVKGGAFSVLDANGGLIKQGALDPSGHTIVSGVPSGAALVKFGADPRQQDQVSSEFKLEKWPTQSADGNSAADAGADTNASAAESTRGPLGALMSAVPSMGGAANASHSAGAAARALQGGASLKNAAMGEGVSFAQQALEKVAPSGAQSALSQLGQVGSIAKQIGGVADMAGEAGPLLKAL